MKSQKMETDFLYSVGLAGFALLNADGSFPSPCDWVDTDDKGAKREHLGGIVFKEMPTYNLSALTSDEDCKLHILYGAMKESVKFKLVEGTGGEANVKDKKAVTLAEIKKIFGGIVNAFKEKGINIKVETIEEEDVKYVKIIDGETDAKTKLPFYAPFGFSGPLASILGIRGYIISEEVKSVKHDFDKEQGKSVDVTSGRGIRCVVKEADKIKGLNLTISMAGQNTKLLSMITGNRYNEKADEFFVEGVEKVPTFAFVYFVKAFAKGENNEGSFEKVKVVCYPSCQTTLPGDNAQEGAFSTLELQASASQNKRSNLPLTFNKGISINNYSTYVESL